MPPAIPPHHSIDLAGIHAYADRESFYPGDDLTLFVSSDRSYDIEVRRLGVIVDDRGSDQIIAAVRGRPAVPQPIYPGSYVHAMGLPNSYVINELSLECWVRPASITGFAGLVTQHDFPSACSYGLFVDDTRHVRMYLGDGLAYASAGDWQTKATLTDGIWHHLVATWNGSTRRLYVNGAQVDTLGFFQNVRGGASPIRLAAYGEYGVTRRFFDGDLAMPAIYQVALTAAEVAARAAARGLTPPGKSLFGCWPLDSRQGDLVVDVGPGMRHGTVINNATWNLGGPSFDEAAVTQHDAYNPSADPRRGSAVRFARDDLYDCAWSATDRVNIPATARPGLYAARVAGTCAETWVGFIVRAHALKPRLVVLANTHTWRAYNDSPFRGGHSDAPVHSFYVQHLGGQPGFQVGLRIPVPSAEPDRGANYHLVRAEHYVHAWLEDAGYDYDVLADSDLDREGAAALASYGVVVLAGHAEYWTTRMFDTLEAWLDGGGELVSLTGNAVWWTVAYDQSRAMLECRKIGIPLGGRTDRWGEGWHAADGERGGLLRDRGRSWSSLSGLMFLAYVETPGEFAPYFVTDASHFLYRTPLATGLNDCDAVGIGTPAAVGHEYDVTVATLLALGGGPPPGVTVPVPEVGIEILADSRLPCARAFDYYGTVLLTVAGKEAGATEQGGQIIYWRRPRGGRVFNVGSVNAGAALWSDKAFSFLVGNALVSAGIRPGGAYDAAFVSQSVPPILTAGQTTAVTVTFKNTGTNVWTTTEGYKLGSQNPRDNGTWGITRVNLAAGDSIGQSVQKTFTFDITAPSTPGTYNFQWQMLQEGYVWFGAVTTNATIMVMAPPSYDSQFVSQSVPTTLTTGQILAVTVTFKNTGANIWTVAAGYKLGSQNPRDSLTWGMGRVTLAAGDSIGHNARKTFTFNITAPSTPGTYNFQWQMLQEGVAWFGAFTPNLAITVTVPP